MNKAIGIIQVIALLVCVAANGDTASAQDANAEDGGLSLELNAVEATPEGCRFTFVMRNGLAQPIEALGFELALFDADGTVNGIIALDGGALPEGKTRVKRYNLPDVACSGVARVLLNDVTQCEGEGLSPAACLTQLSVSSRGGPEFQL